MDQIIRFEGTREPLRVDSSEVGVAEIRPCLRRFKSPDPDDDYLVALARISRSVLVSGDADLLGLSDQIPVYSPTEFVALIEASS